METVLMIPLSQVLDAISVDPNQFAESVNQWSYGDTDHTLVGTHRFLEGLTEELSITPEQEAEYWKCVEEPNEETVYIDLEN